MGTSKRRGAWPGLLFVVPIFYFLYFFALDGVGLIGPDEPRYAAIGREMARSGDWITPRLWGEPWFEKPALSYWLTAAGFRLGLSEDLAPRVPAALMSVAFLCGYWWALQREFGERAAWLATALLGTSAGWVAYSQVAVTDLPMSAAFGASMLLSLRWIERGERGALIGAAALLGLAVLAKGLVPLVLALPVLWYGRKRLYDLLRPAPAAAFLAVAAPWYVLATLRHGTPFLNEFFGRHHFERFATESLQHVQPVWFYVPVLAAGMFPWTPLIALLFQRAVYRDRRQFLLAWFLFGLVFLSVSTNKLPGYVLPLLPPLCALIGLALDEAKQARWLLGLCGALLAALPAVAQLLPEAVARGLRGAAAGGVPWAWLLPAALLGALAWWLERAGRRGVAVGLLSAAAVGGVVYLKLSAYPRLDRTASARALWREVAPVADEACVESLQRGLRYSLNYYSVTPLPDCAEAERPVRIRQDPAGAPVIHRMRH